MEHWSLVECDMHEVYRIDLGDPDVWTSRSWPWLQTRVLGLLSRESSRLHRALTPREAVSDGP